MTDENLEPRASINAIVNPNGWEIPEEASKVHGISQKLAKDVGLKLRSACSMFQAISSRAVKLVAHNIDYDLGIMNTAFDEITVDVRPWNRLPIFCTMKSSANICKIPSKYPKYGPYKWPTLSETYGFFHNGTQFPNAHTALGDVLAVIEVYRKLHAIRPTE